MQLTIEDIIKWALQNLSVSSVGSEAMQLGYGDGVSATVDAFSILGRIGGDATGPPGERYGRGNELSVSSVGSEAMQH